ncbi:hypothetical protein L208DRAFT_1517303 [Tricholoma matsutake]|nr:hypothetical protein L208DRAFT_1517303 [Tricholoma matsutake 945]
MVRMIMCVVVTFMMSYSCTKKIIAQVISNAIKVVLIQQNTCTKMFLVISQPILDCF